MTGSGCAECWNLERGDKRALTTEDFIRKSKHKFGDRFNYTKTEYVRKDIELTLTCPLHGDIVMTPDQHRWSKHGCRECDFDIPKSIKKNKVLEKAKQIHKNKFDYSRVVFLNVSEKVEILCPQHGSFWQDLYSHTVKGTGCPSCARQSDRLTLEAFISKAREVHGDKYGYGKVEYDVGASQVVITCRKHGDFRQRALSHLSGSGCKKCHIEENRISTEEFIRNAKSVHGEKYDYGRVIYQGNKKPVEIVCQKHGSFWQRPNSHTAVKAGCPLCNESKGEIAVENVLKKYGINYIREYRIKPYLYRYDFYIPELDIYIEFNGEQHYKPVDSFGGYEAYLSCKERDENKRSLVHERKATLIVLTYLNLHKGSVEKELIFRLKKAYKYWFFIRGKLVACKTAMDVVRTFSLPDNTLLRNVVSEVIKRNNDIRVLF